MTPADMLITVCEGGFLLVVLLWIGVKIPITKRSQINDILPNHLKSETEQLKNKIDDALTADGIPRRRL